MKQLSVALTALGLVFTTACGGLPNNEGTPSTLVTLHGHVDDPTGTLSQANVRVALIWAGTTNAFLAVDAPVRSTLGGFSLPIWSAPPTQVLITKYTKVPIAVAYAHVVAYRDDNHNGKLDMLNESSPKAIDHIVGADQTHVLVYLKAPLPKAAFDAFRDKNGNLPHAGFNLGEIGKNNSGDSWVPLTTQIVLKGDESADTERLMCTSWGNDISEGPTVNAAPGTIGPNGQYPDPNDTNLDCLDADTYQYTTEQVTVNRPCYNAGTTLTTIYSKAPGTSPAGWPCP